MKGFWKSSIGIVKNINKSRTRGRCRFCIEDLNPLTEVSSFWVTTHGVSITLSAVPWQLVRDDDVSEERHICVTAWHSDARYSASTVVRAVNVFNGKGHFSGPCIALKPLKVFTKARLVRVALGILHIIQHQNDFCCFRSAIRIKTRKFLIIYNFTESSVHGATIVGESFQR